MGIGVFVAFNLYTYWFTFYRHTETQQLTQNTATSTWQTYRDEEFGIEFKYPNDWEYVHVDGTDSNAVREDRTIYLSSKKEEMPGGGIGIQISSTTLENFKKDINKELVLIDSQVKIVNGHEWEIWTQKDDPSKLIYLNFHSKFDENHTISLSVINGTEGEALLDKILSTFKFIEPMATQQTSKGILKGHATIGPNCPVEREGIPCPPPPEAYTSRYIIVYKAGGQTEVARKNFDTKGNYQLELAPGTYIIKTLSGINYYASKTVEIKANQTTILDFDIDTGIR